MTHALSSNSSTTHTSSKLANATLNAAIPGKRKWYLFLLQTPSARQIKQHLFLTICRLPRPTFDLGRKQNKFYMFSTRASSKLSISSKANHIGILEGLFMNLGTCFATHALSSKLSTNWERPSLKEGIPWKRQWYTRQLTTTSSFNRSLASKLSTQIHVKVQTCNKPLSMRPFLGNGNGTFFFFRLFRTTNETTSVSHYLSSSSSNLRPGRKQNKLHMFSTRSSSKLSISSKANTLGSWQVCS